MVLPNMSLLSSFVQWVVQNLKTIVHVHPFAQVVSHRSREEPITRSRREAGAPSAAPVAAISGSDSIAARIRAAVPIVKASTPDSFL
jgi:hypothetical protein